MTWVVSLLVAPSVNCSLMNNRPGAREPEQTRIRIRACFLVLFTLCFAAAFSTSQQSPVPDAQSSAPGVPKDPVLAHRPPPGPLKPAGPVTPEGRIHLDVVVTDAAGKPVTGLQPPDFKVLDDNQPRKLLSFRSFDGIQVKPKPPVEVILVMDTANLPFQQVAFVKTEIAKFLGQNGGHLQQPVSLFLLSDAGLRVQPQPSLDGNALLALLNQLKGSIHTINSAEGAEGLLQRFQLSIRQLTNIAENEANKPGRKLLVWVGPGWPMLNGNNYRFSDKDQRRYFDAIVELSTKLREARIVVYSVSPADSSSTGTSTFLYQNFLKGVRSFKQADTGDLALKVLAVQSGGRILGPDNNLAGQIDQCIADANAFYMLSFDPPPAVLAGAYHDLKVQVSQPGLTARTSTGYYNQP
jgi:VWFA-related protein